MEWLIGDPDYVTGRGMEELPAGPSLAVMLDCVSMGEEPGVGMDQAALLESMRAGQKVQSWAMARTLQAIAEYENRLRYEDTHRYEFLYAEISLAMSITKNAAADLIFLADRLVRHLPDTFQAMRDGRISFPKARIIAIATSHLNEELAAAVEAKVLQKAQQQTTGQLKAATRNAIKNVDPEAFTKKCDAEAQTRRVEVWDNQFGTTDLVGRNLPDTVTEAAMNRLNAIAKGLKDDGDTRSMDQLRADLYIALLLGNPTTPTSAGPGLETESDPFSDSGSGHSEPSADPDIDDPDLPSNPDTHSPGTRTSDLGGQGHGPGSAGLGKSRFNCPWDDHASDPDDPGPAEPVEDEIPEPETSNWDNGPEQHSPPHEPNPAHEGESRYPANLGSSAQALESANRTVTPRQAREAEAASQAREAAALMAEQAHTELTNLIADQLAGHHAPTLERKRLAIAEAGRIFTANHKNDPAASRHCTFTATHDGTIVHGADAYRPPAAMRRLINYRDTTCRFPTCRQPASRTDCDHTVAHDTGGKTCPCNLALLCRFHHRTKQCAGWTLQHLYPGVLLWITPTSGWHIVGPAPP